MTQAHGQLGQAAAGYLQKTHRPLNCLALLLPLLLAYEAGAVFYHDRLLAPRHLALLLDRFGATGRYAPALLVVVVLLVWHVLTHQKWHIDGRTVVGMVIESAVLMVPLRGLGVLTDRLVGHQLGGAAGPLPVAILSGVGAGVYEEFVFRLVGIGLVLLVLVDVLDLPKGPVTAAAVLLTSVLFSLYHFIGPFETFTWRMFIFRSLAGAYLAGLYITRGFGVAVGAHACYNILVAM